MAKNGLTTQEQIDKDYEELDGIEPSWKEETAPEGEPEPKQDKVTPDPEPPKEDPAIAVIKEEARKAEARYNSLQGMFSKQNEELQALKKQVPEPAKPVINVDVQEIDNDYQLLVDEYGEPAARAMKNMTGKALQAAKAELDALREELIQTKAQTGQLVQQQSAISQDRFYAELNKTVPDWNEINAKADEFYQKVEPFTGQTYDTLIKHYAGTGDVQRVASILEMARTTITPAQQEVPPKKSNPLEQMLEPERTGKGTSAPASNTKHTYTLAEYKAFDKDYTNYQAGRLRADPIKIEAKWEEMFNAAAEGRVIGL